MSKNNIICGVQTNWKFGPQKCIITLPKEEVRTYSVILVDRENIRRSQKIL